MFETDDDDFMPSTSSNLSSIFNVSVTPEDNSSSLSYKAPKQPKNYNEESLNISGENRSYSQHSSLILAKVVTLWKLDNGQSKLIGKHIAAVIGNPNQKTFQLIVYQQKTNIIVRQDLNNDFKIYKLPKNFVAFYDYQNNYWNFSFDNTENFQQFLDELKKHGCQILSDSLENRLNSKTDEVDNSHVATFITNNNNNNNNNSNVDKSDALEINNSKEKFDNEQSQKEKVDIMSRITKMGQRILPRNELIGKNSTEMSDSETESSYSDVQLKKPVTAPRKMQKKLNQGQENLTRSANPEQKTLITPAFSSNFVSSNNLLPINNQVMLTPHNPLYSQPYPDYSLTNLLLTQNNELKTSLSEINFKLSSLKELGINSVDSKGNSEEVDNLKSRLKCLNLKIENLSSELENSKRLCNNLQKKYDKKCEEILKERQKSVDITSLEAERNILLDEVKKYETLKTEIDNTKFQLDERNKLVENLELKLKDVTELYNKSKIEKDSLLSDVAELKSQIESLSLEMEIYKSKNRETESTTKLTLDSAKVDRVVKNILNQTFVNIMNTFSENASYNYDAIQEVVLKNLKTTTYTLLSELK